MRAVIFGYFGTLTDPGAEELPVALAHHRSGHARLHKPRPHTLRGTGSK
jgi:hypothetical protein